MLCKYFVDLVRPAKPLLYPPRESLSAFPARGLSSGLKDLVVLLVSISAKPVRRPAVGQQEEVVVSPPTRVKVAKHCENIAMLSVADDVGPGSYSR